MEGNTTGTIPSSPERGRPVPEKSFPEKLEKAGSFESASSVGRSTKPSGSGAASKTTELIHVHSESERGASGSERGPSGGTGSGPSGGDKKVTPPGKKKKESRRSSAGGKSVGRKEKKNK